MQSRRTRWSRYILAFSTVLLAFWLLLAPPSVPLSSHNPHRELINLASPLLGAHVDPGRTTPAYIPGGRVLVPLMSHIGLGGLVEADLQRLLATSDSGVCHLVQPGAATITLELGTSATVLSVGVDAVVMDQPFTVSYVVNGVNETSANGHTGSDMATFDPPIEVRACSGLFVLAFNNKQMQCYHQLKVHGLPNDPSVNFFR